MRREDVKTAIVSLNRMSNSKELLEFVFLNKLWATECVARIGGDGGNHNNGRTGSFLILGGDGEREN
jgi:hypothetical protein